jgi:hypothetical protein
MTDTATSTTARSVRHAHLKNSTEHKCGRKRAPPKSVRALASASETAVMNFPLIRECLDEEVII